MSTLFGKMPKLSRAIESRQLHLPAFDNSLVTYLPDYKSGVLEEAVSRVLQLPAVASKMFLITIGVRDNLAVTPYCCLSCFESQKTSWECYNAGRVVQYLSLL